ncbi:helix-turn-helix domain-containing protein [Streptomyces sp. G45]|uniref:helix-turn-helix domain-containing protein n=1 Tax=Streptomyces sp. G45 TaxID=3406627 RepID=UPI003C25446F
MTQSLLDGERPRRPPVQWRQSRALSPQPRCSREVYEARCGAHCFVGSARWLGVGAPASGPNSFFEGRVDAALITTGTHLSAADAITIQSFPTHHFHPAAGVDGPCWGGWDTCRVKSVRDFSPAGFRAAYQGRGWSQGDVATAVGVSVGTVGRWATGKGAPSPRLFAALVEQLDVPPSDLLEPLASDADLAVLRTRAGLRQEDVAGRLGVQASDVSELELGIGRMRDEWVGALSDLYGVSVDRVRQAKQAADARWRADFEAKRAGRPAG